MATPPLVSGEEKSAAAPGGSQLLSVSLITLISGWPEDLCQELVLLDLDEYNVLFPMEEVDQGLKQGRLEFPWSQLKKWMQPPFQAPLTQVSDDTRLAIPLNVLVPLFMAKKGRPTTGKKVFIDESIPDLFESTSGTPPATPAKPSPVRPQAPAVSPLIPTPPAPQTAPAPSFGPQPGPGLRPPLPFGLSPLPPVPTGPPPMTATHPSAEAASMTPPPLRSVAGPAPFKPTAPAAPGVSSARQFTDVASLFGQPGKTQWTPLELVQKSAGLPGVTGALIALSDGLLVASQMPPNINGEMVAAFLPQMFGRMSHYTRELKLGEPNSLMLTVDRQPLQIFKVGNVYFLAVGQSGENMPIPQLEAVAQQLERQAQQT